jgi:cytochrome c556
MSTKLFSAFLIGAIVSAPSVIAQDRAMQTAIKARQGVMQNYQLNINQIGSMALGKIPYDAEAAQAAADNLVALAGLSGRFSWPAGSDADSIEGTRAKAEIWQNFPDVGAKSADMKTAAAALQAAASGGVEALGPAVGGVGKACSACHDDYRAER